ncbi:MAG: UDP-2,4-diacetamido-2,4,6-trideoxy-beta-L-altropyranose hydrolase [Bacteroidota bacterium]
MKKRVVFRADGGSKIGLGHIYRCLAIAEVLKQAFDCQFIIRSCLPSIEDRIQQVCSSYHILPDSLNASNEPHYLARAVVRATDIVVLDGYHFDTAYQERIKSTGALLVCIDDIFSYHFVADVVINTAGGIREDFYSAAPHTRFYLGPRYALLHPAFHQQRNQGQRKTNNKNIFICLGGADPQNDTLKVLKRCEDMASIEQCHLVTGAAYQHQIALKAFLQKTRLKVKHHQQLSPVAMAQLMQQCSQAICTPSSIAYEYLSIGGELYLHRIADNQDHILDYLTQSQIAFRFEQFPIEAPLKIAKARQIQKEIFNGQSATNILQLFKTLAYAYPQSTC